MLNLAAITGTIESPCKKCTRVAEDKEECSEKCPTLKLFQKYLKDYNGVFTGRIIDVEEAYPIRYWGFEDTMEIDKANSGSSTLIPVGINMTVKNKIISTI